MAAHRPAGVSLVTNGEGDGVSRLRVVLRCRG
jgi:hypothetical protein